MHLNLSVMTPILWSLTQGKLFPTLRQLQERKRMGTVWTRFSLSNLCRDFHFQFPKEEESIGLQGWTADTTIHTCHLSDQVQAVLLES